MNREGQIQHVCFLSHSRFKVCQEAHCPVECLLHSRTELPRLQPCIDIWAVHLQRITVFCVIQSILLLNVLSYGRESTSLCRENMACSAQMRIKQLPQVKKSSDLVKNVRFTASSIVLCSSISNSISECGDKLSCTAKESS